MPATPDTFTLFSNVPIQRIGCILEDVSRGAANPAARHKRFTSGHGTDSAVNLSPFIGRCVTRFRCGNLNFRTNAASDKGANSFHWTVLASAADTSQNLSTQEVVAMPDKIVPADSPQDKLAPYRHYIGLDLFAVMFNDLRLRPTVLEGHIILSLVSLMDLFGDKTYSSYQAWQDHKKRVLKYRPQLKEKFFKLSMVAKDGKSRETEVADLATCIKVIFALNTPTAIQFQDMVADRLAHVTEAELNYRLLSISRGSEWAADTIHEIVKPLPDVPNSELLWWQR